MKILNIITFVLFLVSPVSAYCSDESVQYCFEDAGIYYNISPELLKAVSYVESRGDPEAVHHNTDGSYDYCHMQVNSWWYKKLGEEKWNALADPCYCTYTGAWILSDCIDRFGYNWKALGSCYNPIKGKHYNGDYVAKVQRALIKLGRKK